ncbi:flagellar hook protein FlgE [Celerinatantimonas sp. MCCC 1A17872]|uniref:flagellar hook protein FlgE n=1 Tax=Celerinatantimonas sp. MCCC 1A17872 TaxID=3177514 RepID=UPI0038BEC132
MAFGIALSGINASQKDLDTTSNNIANVDTTGFKESRAEFADVYANSLFSNAKTANGNGAKTTQVAQQFHQGSLKFTQNSLDLAITGEGFFVTSEKKDGLTHQYTRAGAFKLDPNNYIVTSEGNYLQGYKVNSDGTPSAVSMAATKPIQLNSEVGSPTMTSEVDMSFNLPNSAASKDPTLFNPDDSSTYNSSTSATIYDSLGGSHVAQSYFVKVGGQSNTWQQRIFVDGKELGQPHTLRFDNTGSLVEPSPAEIDTPPLSALGGVWDATNGSVDSTQTLKFKIGGSTQFSSAFEVNNLKQDGSTVGKLTGIDIGADGLVKASYSNGVTRFVSKVALAKFNNSQGLSQKGDTSWQQTQSSGEAIAGEPDRGTFGKINSSALEQSNVNLTNQLVNLISAQRNFQANSRALEVDSSLQQTIIQIR